MFCTNIICQRLPTPLARMPDKIPSLITETPVDLLQIIMDLIWCTA